MECVNHMLMKQSERTLRSKKYSHPYERKTEILSEEALDQEKLKDAIGQTGYEVGSIHSEPYQKKFSFPVSFQKIEKNKIGKDSRDGDDCLNE